MTPEPYETVNLEQYGPPLDPPDSYWAKDDDEETENEFMTSDELKAAAAVMLAAADGAQVEVKMKGGFAWRTLTQGESMPGDWQRFDYRIKPEPKYRPWTSKEVKAGTVIVDKRSGTEHLIMTKEIGTVTVAGRGGTGFQYLLDNYTLEDGSPCGTLEEATE